MCNLCIVILNYHYTNYKLLNNKTLGKKLNIVDFRQIQYNLYLHALNLDHRVH